MSLLRRVEDIYSRASMLLLCLLYVKLERLLRIVRASSAPRVEDVVGAAWPQQQAVTTASRHSGIQDIPCSFGLKHQFPSSCMTDLGFAITPGEKHSNMYYRSVHISENLPRGLGMKTIGIGGTAAGERK